MRFSYALKELRRRLSRTLVSAIGLAVGVGLVMGIVGVSNGLNSAESKDLSPLSSVGTDIIVTRTVDAITSTSQATSTTTTSPSNFFRGGNGPGGNTLRQLNSTDQSALLNANSSVLTDLSKLGPAGTQFTYDFFAPGTLITFPSQATSIIAGIQNVTSAVPALSMQAIHESGTVPKIVDTFQTGSQSLNVTSAPPPLTDAQRQQIRTCLQNQGVGFQTRSAGNSGSPPPSGNSGSGGGGKFLGGGGRDLSQAFLSCLPASYQQYETQVVIPSQTISRVLNPPATNTSTNTYTVAGVDVSSPNSGIITKAQLVNGSWYGSSPLNEILVDSAYASSNHISLNQTMTIDKENFKVVGLVNPTLTGDTADIYFDLSTLQNLASNSGRINEVLVKVNNASEVNSVVANIKKQLPGAQVLTAASLADQVSGSLQNAKSLTTSLGTVVGVIVLLAAFLVALLLTLSNITKRYKEIGTLRAIGWTKRMILSQIVLETAFIGLIGAAIGIGLGFISTALISSLLPPLTATTQGLAVGASNAGQLFHQASTGSSSSTLKLTPYIGISTVIFGICASLVGALLAGLFGGLRATRLEPAQAFRDIG